MKPKPLTVFVIVSMTMIVSYTAIALWMQAVFEVEIPQWVTVCWFSYWGSEIFLTTGIKIANEKKLYNKITEADDVTCDSDEAVG